MDTAREGESGYCEYFEGWNGRKVRGLDEEDFKENHIVDEAWEVLED